MEQGKDRKTDETGGEDEMDEEWGLFVFQHPCRGNVNPQFTPTEIRFLPAIRLQHPRRGNVNPQFTFAEVSCPLYWSNVIIAAGLNFFFVGCGSVWWAGSGSLRGAGR